MASLTNTAIAARKIIRYSVFFLILLVIARIIINISVPIYKKLFPPPPPAPTVSFGKLPQIPFPTKEKLSNVKFTLETPDGNLPKFTDQLKVYFVQKSYVSLYSLDIAKGKAASLGFPSNIQQLSPTLYQFSSKTAPATLQLDMVTWNFSIKYDLKADSTPLDFRPATPDAAIQTAKSFLNAGGLLSPDLTGPAPYMLLKTDSGRLVPALALSDTKIIKVSLYRAAHDKLPTVCANSDQSNVWFLISGSPERGKQIISGEYHYYSIDETKNATYPIKTARAAWDELASGKAYFANIGDNKNDSEVKIRHIYLAYYDSDVYTEFFQPVVVFEGDNNFTAYVPAIHSSYYSQ